jgi:gamma-glutamyltranspeptidase/glutathione hydrolase
MVSTSHPYATEAALEALKNGGNAVDAWLAAALVQTVVEPVMTTLAGGIGFTFYQAESRTPVQLGGIFATPKEETGAFRSEDYQTGRTVMIPGWVAGAYDASKRHGKLPWKDLFPRAIHYAEEGFPIDHLLWGWTFEYSKWLGRYPEGREIWYPDGHLLGVGDRLRQPKLALTLRRLASEGPSYFYTGPFARKFVDAVRRHGGHLSPEDLANFKPGWKGEWVADVFDEPIPPRGRYRQYEVLAPSNGMIVFALNLVEAGDLRRRGRPSENGDSLYYLMRIVQEAWHQGEFYNLETRDQLLSKEFASAIWPIIEKGPPRPYGGIRTGTCAITIVDREGNVTFGDHSSTSTPYGTGIFVDGVVANRVVFNRLSSPARSLGTSFLVLENGQPRLTVASPSRSYFSNILQNAVNMLEFGMEPAESVSQPLFGAPGEYPSEEIEGSVSEPILEALGKRGISPIVVAPGYLHLGSCHAVSIDPGTRTLKGVADPRRRGMAKGW